MEWFIKIENNNNVWELLVDNNFFNKDVILKASYQFLDSAYFFFKKDSDWNFIVQITKKDEKLDLEKFIWSYYDELINFTLRVSLEKENKEIRDKIFDTAIWKSLDYSHYVWDGDLNNSNENNDSIDFDKDIDEILKEIENDPDLKIDEDEINKILKEIENESFDENVNTTKNDEITLDINWLEDVKKKFQSKS